MTRRTNAERLADLEVVYRQHQEFVWRTLCHFGLRGDGVNDAVQEVFMVVHRRLDTFDGRASIKNWLYGIARRVASDQRKKDRRAFAKLQLVRSSSTTSDVSTLLDEFCARDLVERILQSMGGERREAFVLAEVEGMTAPEIAEAIGVNVNTVYSRLRAARKQFHREARRHRLSRGRRLA